ncbi:unnamed protein product [Adineta ricciae]|uniref:Uncharacterized protein n=2 Tax=Adineta ricciae TaxID=249248 RepID=A0A815EM82_ADIRI|nr:unnamed protein product [Adineta ricciae]
MAFHVSYNMYPYQMQYYEPYSYSSYYGLPSAMTTEMLSYPDEKPKAQKKETTPNTLLTSLGRSTKNFRTDSHSNSSFASVEFTTSDNGKCQKLLRKCKKILKIKSSKK